MKINSLITRKRAVGYSPDNMAVLLSEPEAWRPQVPAPATYRSGMPRPRSWISDFGSRIFAYNS